MDVRSTNPPDSAQANPASPSRKVQLSCPACAYPLKHVQEAGLTFCPECGEFLDFTALETLHKKGQNLGDKWLLLFNVLARPKRFFDSLKTPRCYMQPPGHQGLLASSLDQKYRFYQFSLKWGMLGSAVCALLAAPLSVFGFVCLILGVLWAVIVSMAHAATSFWVRYLLTRIGHEQPESGEQRVMFFSTTVLPFMALDCWLLTFSLGATGWPFPVQKTVQPIIAAAVLAYVALWLYWSWIILRAFQAETRGMEIQEPWRAFLNPGLALAILGPLVIFGALIII